MPGSTTPSVSEIATDASTALPPAHSVSRPAWVAVDDWRERRCAP